LIIRLTITYDGYLDGDEYPTLSNASTDEEIFNAIKEEHILDDILIPDIESQHNTIIELRKIKG